MSKNLAAHTPVFPAGYPPYINISLSDDGTHVEVTVRSPPKADGHCGDVAMIALPIMEYDALIEKATHELFFATKGEALQALRKAS